MPPPLREHCWVLSLPELRRQGVFQQPSTQGRLEWLHPETGEVGCAVGFVLQLNEDHGWLVLAYRIGEHEIMDPFALEVVHQPQGGVRWIGRCSCRAAYHKLYLAPGEKHFRCRLCTGIGYASNRYEDRRVNLVKRDRVAMDLALLKAQTSASWRHVIYKTLPRNWYLGANPPYPAPFEYTLRVTLESSL